MIDTIDFPKLVQKLRVAIVKASDLAELRPVTSFVFYDLAPDFDLAVQQRPIRIAVTIVVARTDHVSEGVNPVRSHIAGGWLIGMPDIVSHMDAVEPIIAAPKQARNYHPPSTIGDNLSRTNALVFEPRGKLVVIWAPDHGPPARYFAGCGSGLVTGGGLLGALLGGGGITGSAVGDTGSSSGITV
jgi:hypothetical protein